MNKFAELASGAIGKASPIDPLVVWKEMAYLLFSTPAAPVPVKAKKLTLLNDVTAENADAEKICM